MYDAGKICDDAERGVNKWLSDNQGFEIISRQTSTTGGGEGGNVWVNYTVFIFYKEREIVVP